jgi:DsbC/DsbD-like thiol-disulfide interchange protein
VCDATRTLVRMGCLFPAVLCLMLVSCNQGTTTGKVAEKQPEGPVTASIDADPRQLRPGDPFHLIVRARIAPGWHIYAVDKPAAAASRTSLEIEVPQGIERAGEWILPQASPDATLPGDLSFIYDGAVTFRSPLRVAADAAAGEKTIRCVLEYQACDRFSCRPPTETALLTTIRIVP